MSALRKIRRQRSGLLYPCETVDNEAETGSRGWNIRGWFLVFVFSSILLGLLGLRSEMKKNTKVSSTNSQIASAVMSAVAPDNTVVDKSLASVPAPATNTNVVKTVTIKIRPQLGQ